MKFLGYCCPSQEGNPSPVTLADRQAVIRFIKENLQSPSLIITDSGDRQLLLMRDGVDLFNELDRIGIWLPAIYDQIRAETIQETPQPDDKPEWERLYDQIGLSPGEIRMRQRVKAACRAAQSVAEVAEIVRGTYFDAHFLTADGQKWYRFFHEDDYSTTMMTKDENGKWIDEPERVTISPAIQVRHLRSSEDVHTFELMDTPVFHQ